MSKPDENGNYSDDEQFGHASANTARACQCPKPTYEEHGRCARCGGNPFPAAKSDEDEVYRAKFIEVRHLLGVRDEEVKELQKTSPSGRMALKIGSLKDENKRLRELLEDGLGFQDRYGSKAQAEWETKATQALKDRGGE